MQNGVRKAGGFHVRYAFSRTGTVTFSGTVYIQNVDRDEGTSLQLIATTDEENATLEFRVVEVSDGQESVVTLNSSGYLVIAPGANVTFFIDVSLYCSLHLPP